MLVLGTEVHRDDIKRMALAFFNASPYKPLSVDPDRIEELIDVFFQSKPTDRITILWVADGEPRGLLAAVAETNLFNYQRFAGELVWWLDPEYRRGHAASKMIEAYEYWAKEKAGCQSCSLVDLLGNLDKYYTRKGYERRETTYLKVF